MTTIRFDALHKVGCVLLASRLLVFWQQMKVLGYIVEPVDK
ncbi:hypothetical protein [Photorhabdus akhurstii]